MTADITWAHRNVFWVICESPRERRNRMDLPDGELRGKVGPWAAFDDFAQCVAPLALGCAEKGERGGGGAILTGRMREEDLYLSCLLCSWHTGGCTYQLRANLLMKSRRRAWLNMEQPACHYPITIVLYCYKMLTDSWIYLLNKWIVNYSEFIITKIT